MPYPRMPSLDQLRRDAKSLKKAFETGDAHARARVASYAARPGTADLKHADFLHVIARENGFESWPKLSWAAETIGLDRAARQQRLKVALFHGQMWQVEQLLSETPDLASDQFGLACALYDSDTVLRWLADDPACATRDFSPRRPMLHLAFSRYHKVRPDLTASMIVIAEALVANGANVNDTMPTAPDNDHPLSALYGAIGHADNMVLGRWLLEHGANPNDGESLYHATELGHHEGLKMLLDFGADPTGTNALLRAMDFHDHAAVRMLLDHGAQADEFDGSPVGGEAPWVVPALHQAARRGSDRRMVDMLLDAGADPARVYQGAGVYGYARVFGNRALAQALEDRGQTPPLSREETLMARAADGQDSPGEFIDPHRLPDAYRNIIHEILHLPGRLEQVKRLVALGLECDRPDAQGLTPVQMAGWEGPPEVMGYFLSLRPDLGHVNGYGGTLLSTIMHGSENCPDRDARDHIACLRMALENGAAMPRRAAECAGRADVAEFLTDWARAYPGQVV
ncbi:ankyrin repeat domain-containing protein [Mesobacterium sp. TK19101]|uniref:Ankyrin repeat domain-containing protein n=1 Tax=Mesobacterium hydrothermale TaxID=3111907 RepID=A0ABU6HB25_9RHOB|nr:ankyrin repeat domain-containing protein [Mesobacterium sp. TK19101]MEC3859672.1 ankyrin repeat domain-containing protein [Mesobacterium sp. TK19101]